MKLQFLWKDQDSNGGHCPALYRGEGGTEYVVQGKKIDADTRSNLRDLADDETAVVVPANVIERIIDEGR